MKCTLPLSLITVGALLAGTPLTSEAKKLPKNAKPMTVEEITAIYRGNSMVWPVSKVYFSPERKVKGVFGKGKTHDLFGRMDGHRQ